MSIPAIDSMSKTTIIGTSDQRQLLLPVGARAAIARKKGQILVRIYPIDILLPVNVAGESAYLIGK
jgi:hypothetical protein